MEAKGPPLGGSEAESGPRAEVDEDGGRRDPDPEGLGGHG